jgi:hypothetical protein
MPKTTVPAELQERTDILFQELQSELGKYGANQFVLMRTAIHFEDNESSVINPQELMNTDSSSICRILEPVAESLIRNHRLCPGDDWEAISTELVHYL